MADEQKPSVRDRLRARLGLGSKKGDIALPTQRGIDPRLMKTMVPFSGLLGKKTS